MVAGLTLPKVVLPMCFIRVERLALNICQGNDWHVRPTFHSVKRFCILPEIAVILPEVRRISWITAFRDLPDV